MLKDRRTLKRDAGCKVLESTAGRFDPCPPHKGTKNTPFTTMDKYSKKGYREPDEEDEGEDLTDDE